MTRRAAMKALSSLIDEKEGKLPVEAKLLSELDRFIETNQAPYEVSASYNPSGMSCARALYFKRTGHEAEPEVRSAMLIGITESGSSRHETLQSYLIGMSEDANYSLQWVDVEEYIKHRGLDYLQVLSKQGHEVKLKDTRFDMNFLCDGIILYNDKYYIVEIKTETSGKFRKHDDVRDEHKMQAWCYSMALQIRDVIFIYENRDFCTRKTALLHVTETDWDEIEEIIKGVEEAIKTGVIPPMPEGVSCNYCRYKGICMAVTTSGYKQGKTV